MFNSNQRATAMPAMFGALDSLLKDRKFISGAHLSRPRFALQMAYAIAS